MSAAHRLLRGIGVSPGVAVGPVARVQRAVGPPDNEAPPDDAADAGRQVRGALEQVAVALEQRAAAVGGGGEAILSATAMMARDPGLATAVDQHLGEGLGVTSALAAAVQDYTTTFEAAGGYLADRVVDLRDVRDRATARLLGMPEPGLPQLDAPCVLVTDDLAPAETVMLRPGQVLGVVTELGGPTSHTAILAAGLGIPAVVQVAGASTVGDATTVALDGNTGEVLVWPSPDGLEELRRRSQRRAAALTSRHGDGLTRNGTPVPLLTNVGTAADAERAAAADVEGVGLFRTEFLFLDRDTAPSLEEQTTTYTRVLSVFGDRRVVVRTLDAGADKPLAFASLGKEDNPALGRRGLRLSRARPDLLDTQLRALAEAQRETGADLRVMAPMVTTVDEARWFAEKARSHGIRQVGVMIEVPAAALRARHLLAGLDFASLGTNDLQQYVMATDRTQGALGELLDPWQPAVLDLVATACEGGAQAGTPVGLCGESGGDPLLALVMVGLGAGSLSMSLARVPAVRASLAVHDMATCRSLAAVARAAVTAAEAREAVLAEADPLVRNLS